VFDRIGHHTLKCETYYIENRIGEGFKNRESCIVTSKMMKSL